MEIEREYKALIDEKTYHSLIDKLSDIYNHSIVVQKNIYYDTDSFSFYNKNETLRIRVISDTMKLEYKRDKTIINGMRQCKETSLSIYETPEILPQSALVELSIKITNPIKKIGSALTHRDNFKTDNMIISLDHTTYLNSEDYEIEVEILDDTFDLDKIDSLAKIDFTKPILGKYTRFIELYKYKLK